MDTLLCGTCGNPYPADHARCPYCGAGAEGAFVQEAPVRYTFREVNLKAGMPTVEEALVRLRAVMEQARAEGTNVLKLIHGYGSTGQGGRIRTHVRRVLQGNDRVDCFIPGEDVRRRSPCRTRLLQGLPALKHDPDFQRPNRGVTFVLLG